MNGKMAVIGEGDGVLVFQSVGMDAFTAEDAPAAARILKEIAERYRVIFVTDVLAAQLEEEIGRYASQAYPIVVPIPSVNGGNGYGAELLRRQSERALGMDILVRGEQGAGDRPDGEDNAR